MDSEHRVDPDPLAVALGAVARVAARTPQSVFVVGGLVRDQFAGRLSNDLDLVIEGEVAPFARGLAAELGVEIERESEFGTVVLEPLAAVSIDVAAARTEVYESPGALPQVTLGATIEEDLKRRDFSINAMARPAIGFPESKLIDPYGGRRDLEQGELRALHADSFSDDPTRAFRGAEFKTRFALSWERQTYRWARAAVRGQALDRLGPTRFTAAWDRLFRRAPSRRAGQSGRIETRELLDALDELGAVRALAAGAVWGEDVQEVVRELEETARKLDRPLDWPVVMAGLFLTLSPSAQGSNSAKRWDFGRRGSWLGSVGYRLSRLDRGLQESRRKLTPSERDGLLSGLGDEELLLLSVLGDERTRFWAREALLEFKTFSIDLTGEELLAAGVEAGPELGAALRAVRAARLDDQIAAEQELEFALSWLDRGGG